VEEPWNGLEQNDEESDDEESDDDDEEEVDDDEEEVDEEGMDVDGEDEDEGNEDEEEDGEASDAEMGDSQVGEGDDEIELPRLSHKQKRKRGPEKSMPLPPAKKVSFGVMPPTRARGSKSDHRQKLGPTTKGKDKLKGSRSKPSPLIATPANPTSEKKSKIANVAPKVKAKGTRGLTQQSKDKSESEAYDFGKFF